MFTLLPPFWLIRIAVAAVWLYEGLWCKILYGQPHELEVFVLHAFEKKAERTSKRDIELAKGRLSELMKDRR